MLQLVTRILGEAGYETVIAPDGHQAWGIVQRGIRRIDLVLTDVVMPHMAGTELAARIAARAPEMPVVLMSGYTSEDMARRGLILSHGHLLTKPFTPDELLSLVRRLLPA